LGDRLENGSSYAIGRLSVCPVCDVRALWPNGWTDHDETWHAGRPRPCPLCVRWGPSSPSPKRGRSPQFSAHICCSQMARWIKMPLGMEVGLSPCDFVRWGPRSTLPKMAAEPPSQFSVDFYCGQTAAIPLHASKIERIEYKT